MEPFYIITNTSIVIWLGQTIIRHAPKKDSYCVDCGDDRLANNLTESQAEALMKAILDERWEGESNADVYCSPHFRVDDWLKANIHKE